MRPLFRRGHSGPAPCKQKPCSGLSIGLVSSRRTNVCVGRLRELRATRDWAGCMELEAEACSVTVQASEPATAAEIYNTLGNGLEVMKEKRRATL